MAGQTNKFPEINSTSERVKSSQYLRDSEYLSNILESNTWKSVFKLYETDLTKNTNL